MRGQTLRSFNRSRKGFDKVQHPFLIKEKITTGALSWWWWWPGPRKEVRSWWGKEEPGNLAVWLTSNQSASFFIQNPVSRDRFILFRNRDHVIFVFRHAYNFLHSWGHKITHHWICHRTVFFCNHFPLSLVNRVIFYNLFYSSTL